MKISIPLKYLLIILNIKNFKFFWHYWLGLQNMVSHRYGKAILQFNECIKSECPPNILAIVYEQIGKCYFDINEIEKGKSFLLRFLQMQSESDKISSEVTSRLGFIFYKEGDLEKAEYYLQKALKDFKKIDYTNIEAVKEYLDKAQAKD